MAKISADISADSFYEAEAAMFDAVSPYLSMLSLYHDVPYRVAQVDVRQKSTDCLSWTVTHPYFDRISYVKGPLTADRVYSPFIRGLFALYREGINGNSPNYQFLRWYKIVEAINWKRSNDVATRALPLDNAERLPETAEKLLKTLKDVFPSLDGKKLKPSRADLIPAEVLGWKFNKIRQQKLEPVRNKIAHMLTNPTGELGLSPDNTQQADEVKTWLTVLRLIARVMIANEIDRESKPRKTV